MRPVNRLYSPDALDRNGVATDDFSGAGRDFVIDGDLATAADVDAICDEQTTTASAALVLNGAQAKNGVIKLAFPQFITLTSDGNDSGIDFEVYGRKWDGTALHETITGPNTTSTSTNVWSQIDMISVTGATTGTVSVGVPAYAAFDIPRHAGVYSGNNDAADVFTINGIDRDGNYITDTVTGVNATTVPSSKNFKYILSGSVGSATGGNVELGTTGSFDTEWVPVSRFAQAITLGGSLSSGGSLTFAAEYTLDDIRISTFNGEAANVKTAYSAKTSNHAEAAVGPLVAVRSAITSYASGTFTFEVVDIPQI